MSEDEVIALVERLETDFPEEISYMNATAPIGHNFPPEPTPFEAAKAQIEDLYIEAQNFLDGEEIKTPEIAAEVKKLENDLKAAIKQADEARSSEYKPLNDAKAEIQARYEPLIGGSKCDGGTGGAALAACKKALTPYLIEQHRIKDEEARKAREEAERISQEAIEAHRKANEASLADQERAAALLKQSEDAQKAAARAEKATTIKTGLRTTYNGEIVDLSAVAKHVWTNDPDGLRMMMQSWVDRTVSSFGQNAAGLTIPGVKINSTVEAR